jgi:hypothetical protein
VDWITVAGCCEHSYEPMGFSPWLCLWDKLTVKTEYEWVNVQIKLLHICNLLNVLFNASVSCLDHVASVIVDWMILLKKLE